MDRDRDGVVDAEDVAWAAWRGGLLCEEAEVAALLEERGLGCAALRAR
jgi:hypothetical protein